MSQTFFEKAMALIDAANSEDPNHEADETGKRWPKEHLYAQRMSNVLQRFMPDADDVSKLAIRAQHIQRWKSPRSNYPMDRNGYLKWRTDLYRFHAETLGKLMTQAGYSAADVERAGKMVGKKSVKSNPDAQLLEDVASLVFIEYYMLEFAGKHPEYDEAKWIGIIQKTWKKMSAKGQQFALSGGIKLPEPLVPLIQKALA
jgi:hypothetical protein